ncbi:MAG TPA: hypothetical protein VN669_16285 [Candidatus Acidoferrales bacterium]|nr:hypothetical protein [Candidatus Acidoferrales bacterium]
MRAKTQQPHDAAPNVVLADIQLAGNLVIAKALADQTVDGPQNPELFPVNTHGVDVLCLQGALRLENSDVLT